MTEVMTTLDGEVAQVDTTSTASKTGGWTSESENASSASLPPVNSNIKSGNEVTTATLFDDIFDAGGEASEAPAGRSLSQSHYESPRSPLLCLGDISDTPRLRSIHVTAGYRDGIADGKTRSVQAGFDEGYSLGAVMGLNVGWILGTLKGLITAIIVKKQEQMKIWKEKNTQQVASKWVNTTADQFVGLSGEDEGLKFSSKNPPGYYDKIQSMLVTSSSKADERSYDISQLRALQSEAEKSLSAANLFGSEFFGEDGVWLYDVPCASEAGDGVGVGGFEEIAAAHPQIKVWKEVVLQWAQRLRIDVNAMKQIRN